MSNKVPNAYDDALRTLADAAEPTLSEFEAGYLARQSIEHDETRAWLDAHRGQPRLRTAADRASARDDLKNYTPPNGYAAALEARRKEDR